MFLDDELLKMCEDSVINQGADVQELNKVICKKCEDYYKSKLSSEMSVAHVKITLDKVFNLFDSFVRMAITSKIEKVKILGELFEKHTFKKQFLSNEKMNEIYNKL